LFRVSNEAVSQANNITALSLIKKWATRKGSLRLKKALAFASAFFCEEAHKRCARLGKNAKKVRNYNCWKDK
jgi:hypothetical protein